jgi:hypothetical protein
MMSVLLLRWAAQEEFNGSRGDTSFRTPRRLICTRCAKRLKIRLQILLRALEQHHELLLLPAQPADLRDA